MKRYIIIGLVITLLLGAGFFARMTVAQTQSPVPYSNTSAQPSTCAIFTRSIGIGTVMNNAESRALSKILQDEGIAALNSQSNQTYNELYASYIVAFQEKYASRILAPNGLARGTGYVGPSTRAKLNEISCSQVSYVTPSVTPTYTYTASPTYTYSPTYSPTHTLLPTAVYITGNDHANNLCKVDTYSNSASSYNAKLFNVDFGPLYGNSSKKTGKGVVGNYGDTWNAVAVMGCDDHNKAGLKNADGSDSPIVVRLTNLGGGWATSASGGSMGINDSMLDDFLYPEGNKGGVAKVTMSNIPAGSYDLYIYNKTMTDDQNGIYEVTSSGASNGQSRSYGQKETTTDYGSNKASEWQDGNQFVKFSNVTVDSGGSITVLIKPHQKMFRDAQISGLQLALAGTAYSSKVTTYRNNNATYTPTPTYVPNTTPSPSYTPEAGRTTNPTINVVSPNGGEAYVAGQTMRLVRWDSRDLPSWAKIDNITFTLNGADGSKYRLSITRSPSFVSGFDGKFNLNGRSSVSDLVIPANIPAGTYTLTIACPSCGNASDTSNSRFTIKSASEKPSINLILPNSGQKIEIGKTMIVKWSSKEVDASEIIDIGIYNRNSLVNSYSIGAGGTVNSGMYSWNLPSYVVPGEYALQVSCRNCEKKYGVSVTAWSKNFNVVYPSVTPSVTPTETPAPSFTPGAEI